MENIIDFPGNNSQEVSPAEPEHYVYSVKLKLPDGTVETVEQIGYLIATGAFIGICQGPYGHSEFSFMAPMGTVVYANRLTAVKTPGAFIN